MKIGMINGSPKPGGSNSGIILDRLNKFIKGKHEVKMYNLGAPPGCFNDETYKEITSKDIIVFAFPLYGDSVPSNALKMLIELEGIIKRGQAGNIIMYTLANNGFYEGKQNHVVLEIIQHWCERSGVQFGGGIGQGSGELLGVLKNNPVHKIIFYKLYRSLKLLVKKMEAKESFGLMYLNPNFPRFLYMAVGKLYFQFRARKNGVSGKDMDAIPL